MPPRDPSDGAGPRDGPTTAQLRADIDAGRTGDKVNVLDPAASPLGTDDEAAGLPPPPEAVALAQKIERTGVDRLQAAEAARLRNRVRLVVAMLLLLVVIVTTFFLWLRYGL